MDVLIPRASLSPHADEALEFVTELGASLLAASAPVSTVKRFLDAVTPRYGFRSKCYVLPTGIVAVNPERKSMTLVLAEPASYRFDQTLHLFALMETALRGRLDSRDGLRRLAAIGSLAAPSPLPVIYVGHVLLTAGVVLSVASTWEDVGVSVAIGLATSLLIVIRAANRTLATLLPAMAAFVAASIVFSLTHARIVSEPLSVLVPPLATLLPGTVLTIGAIELSEGSMQSGSGRIVSGVFQLFVLAFGIGLAGSVTGMALVGAPESATDISWWAPWLGVATFAVGAATAFCAPAGAVPGLVMVAYAAWMGQTLGHALLGVYLSGFVGAMSAVLAASFAHRRLGGPPVLLTIAPAFWLLVPGGLSLVGITKIATGGAGGTDVASAVFTILSIALGTVAGVAADNRRRAR